jgi:hypothetical protein
VNGNGQKYPPFYLVVVLCHLFMQWHNLVMRGTALGTTRRASESNP